MLVSSFSVSLDTKHIPANWRFTGGDAVKAAQSIFFISTMCNETFTSFICFIFLSLEQHVNNFAEKHRPKHKSESQYIQNGRNG